MAEQYLTRVQVAQLVSLSPMTIWRLTRDKVLPAVRIGKSWRYRRADIDNYLNEGSNQRAGGRSE